MATRKKLSGLTLNMMMLYVSEVYEREHGKQYGSRWEMVETKDGKGEVWKDRGKPNEELVFTFQDLLETEEGAKIRETCEEFSAALGNHYARQRDNLMSKILEVDLA